MCSRLTPEREAEIRDAPPDILFSPMLEDLLAEIDFARSEIHALRVEIEGWKHMGKMGLGTCQDWRERAEKAEAERDTLKKEVEYRTNALHYIRMAPFTEWADEGDYLGALLTIQHFITLNFLDKERP
jgi:hypothetical protein